MEVARWDITRRAITDTEDAILITEAVGVAFLVGSSLFQTVTVGQGFGLIAILLGVLVTMWGIATRVRRRVRVGAGVIGLTGLLLVAVPLAKAIPQFRGITLWATLAGAGAVMIVIAVTLERGRALVQSTMLRIEELMEGWE